MPPLRHPCPPLVRVALGLALLVAHVAAAPADSDNWAVIVSSSRYWLNYRHTANALGVYQAVRRLGIPDRRIILMLADQHACSPRNVRPGQLFLAPSGGSGSSSGSGVDANLQAPDVEVDYRGREVGVDSVLRVLTGHHAPGTPASKRLRSGPASHVLLYLTGHGGDEFLKFHDEEELLAADVANALHQMHAAGRYGELLLVADTCQASTLYSRVTAPNVLAVASSKLGQSSYAHHIDTVIGQHVVDQLTFHLHAFLTTRLPPHPSVARAGGSSGSSGGQGGAVPSLQQLLDYITAQRMSSDLQVRTDLYPRRLVDVPVTHFFAAAPAVGGSSGGSSGKAAAEALQRLAVQPVPGGELPEAAAAQQQYFWQEMQQQQQGSRLFMLLEAANGGAGSSVLQSGGAAAVVMAAWAATGLLAHRLLKS